MQLVAELSQISNQQSEITYQYDAYGRSAGFDAGTNYSVRYTFDPLGRFLAVSNNVGGALRAATYSYVSGSDLVAGYTTDAGFSLMRSYEPRRNLMVSITNGFGGVSLHRFDYANDEIGRRVKRADVDISTVISNQFAYNALSELEDAAMGTNSFSYRYDPIGNRRTATNNAEALAYAANSLNQYTNITDSSATSNPSYDLDGNMTSYRDWIFIWDAENRLVLASNATTVVSNSYDYMSRRVSKTVSSPSSSFIPHTSSFLYQGWAMIAESTATSTNSYIYGLDLSGTAQGAGTIGAILSLTTEQPSNSTTVFYCYDANGNVTDLVGTNGSILAQYQFDPYGNTIRKTGVLADVNPFRFSTKYLDAETGLYYYGHRYCQPETGRWASREPVGEWGGYNLYGFIWNDTVSFVDYLGLIPLGGNYIGPNWTAGQNATWEETTPEQRSGNPPQGRVDAIAKVHDECYANCRSKHNGKCPEDEKNLDKCINDCDRNMISSTAKVGK